jgi:hypothetical protein
MRTLWSFTISLLTLSLFPFNPVTSQVPKNDFSSNNPARSLKEPHVGGTTNIHVLRHIPLGGWSKVLGIKMEQELSRPYVYVARADWAGDISMPSKGVDIISIKDPAKASVIYSWRIPNAELHQGIGGRDNAYVKLKGRYYLIHNLQFGQGGPDADVGAVVLDVTGLPDTTRIRQVGFIRTPDSKGGFHNGQTYRHSDGRALLFTTGGNPGGRIYDMEKFLAGDANYGLIRKMPVPEDGGAGRSPGYHDFFIGYDPATKRDIFYGAGAGGYHVYDVSRPEEPQLIVSLVGIAGVSGGHTFTPTPDGRYIVAETEYQYAPLRIFDLKPGLDGKVKTISRPIGAWQGSWDGLPHNHEVRWPYVFVTAYMDGFQVFNIMDPTNPYTVGYHYTCQCILPQGKEGAGQIDMEGGSDLDIRNADGLIVTTDRRSGFWVFRMDGFDGWNGHQWGMPNVSSAQDWDNGPDGAPKPVRVSVR